VGNAIEGRNAGLNSPASLPAERDADADEASMYSKAAAWRCASSYFDSWSTTDFFAVIGKLALEDSAVDIPWQ